MSIKINEIVYLTLSEAAMIMDIHPTLMSHYVHRNEFPGMIDLNDHEPMVGEIARHSMQVPEEKIAKFSNERQRRYYLIPFNSVLEKMERRKNRKVNAEINKKKKALKKAGLDQDVQIDIEVL